MLIAVVTPVYNGAKFLAAAMEAVQAQTYRPLVHVVLDNASTDDTPAIIAAYQNKGVPIVTTRNTSVMPAAANWSEAVRLVPDDVAYFKILCADDLMTPDAIAKMAAVVRSADDVRVVLGAERIDGAALRTNVPPECSAFESANMLARIFGDVVHPAYHHAMYRADLRGNDDFFPSGLVSFDADAGFRALARGGRCGFVQEPIFETITHEGTLTATWTNKVAAQHWEHLTRILRFAPAALSADEYQRVLGRHLRIFHRKLLAWRFKGRGENVKRDLERLAEQGLAPSLIDYAMSVLTWPSDRHFFRVAAQRPLAPWPAMAVKPADQKTPPAPPVLRDIKRNAS